LLKLIIQFGAIQLFNCSYFQEISGCRQLRLI
jgi:hypothetical protein